MRQQRTAGTDVALGEVVVAIHDRPFQAGPGTLAGIAKGMILGYLDVPIRLVPRSLAMLGIIGGRLAAASGIAIMLGGTERGSGLQGIATNPESIREPSFGVYLIVKASSRLSRRRK
jgi:hypothetical protein